MTVNMNKEICIIIIFVMILVLYGYILFSIGFLSVSLQKTFKLYNDKLDYLQEIILKNNDNSVNKKKKKTFRK
jgi:hypothetical protein